MKVLLNSQHQRKIRLNDAPQNRNGRGTTATVAAPSNGNSGGASGIDPGQAALNAILSQPSSGEQNSPSVDTSSNADSEKKSLWTRICAGILALGLISGGIVIAARRKINGGAAGEKGLGSGRYVAKDGTRHETWEARDNYEDKQKDEKQTSTALAIWSGKQKYKDIDGKDEFEVRDIIKATGISSNGIVKHEWGDVFQFLK
ncbi:MAG: hypothetical protein SFU25_05385 [Candidatus Caenarcaniphilales bacterium]|nr:hypothetical protein [Candidatus Caenarcaniphilales bacterium]